jgi:hypothetical protein
MAGESTTMNKKLQWAGGALACAVGLQAAAGTVYLCRALAGGDYWSSSPCDARQGIGIRNYAVPDGMTFEQQVAMAQQQQAASRSPGHEQHSGTPRTPQRATPRADKAATCDALNEEIGQVDALARQGQSAQGQENLRQRRERLRTRQFRLGC